MNSDRDTTPETAVEVAFEARSCVMSPMVVVVGDLGTMLEIGSQSSQDSRDLARDEQYCRL